MNQLYLFNKLKRHTIGKSSIFRYFLFSSFISMPVSISLQQNFKWLLASLSILLVRIILFINESLTPRVELNEAIFDAWISISINSKKYDNITESFV